MPELPEVETVLRGIRPAMEGRRFATVLQRRPDLRRPFPADMPARLTGARVDAMRRRSKYILAELSSGETLVFHLGMSGRILVQSPEGETAPGVFHYAQPADGKHDHAVFVMEGGARIVFNDPRRFGAIDLVATATRAAHPIFAELGPEPLSNDFSAARLADGLAGRAAPAKAILLDQRVVAGLGNIYVCEALWRAGVAPTRPGGAVKAEEATRLYGAILETLREAIAAGGSSLKDYRAADGSLGYFQHSFAVYGREGAPCPRCAARIERIAQSGRSSFFCPACQS